MRRGSLAAATGRAFWTALSRRAPEPQPVASTAAHAVDHAPAVGWQVERDVEIDRGRLPGGRTRRGQEDELAALQGVVPLANRDERLTVHAEVEGRRSDALERLGDEVLAVGRALHGEVAAVRRRVEALDPGHPLLLGIPRDPLRSEEH